MHQPLPKAAPAATPAPASAPAPLPPAASESPAPPPTQPTLQPTVVAAVAPVAPVAPAPARAVQPPPPTVVTENVWPAPFKFPESSSVASSSSAAAAAPTSGRRSAAAASASAAAAAAAVAERAAAEEAEAMAALSPLERELGRALRVVLPEQREAAAEEADGAQAMDESDDFYECALPSSVSCRSGFATMNEGPHVRGRSGQGTKAEGFRAQCSKHPAQEVALSY